MKKILLINPLNDSKTSYYGVHFAYCSLCSYYEKYGKNFKKIKFEIFDECLDIKKLEDYDCAKYFLIGLSLTTPQFRRAKEIIKYLKIHAPRSIILAGGVHATLKPDEVLESGADIVCIGEGEATFLDLLDNHYFGKMKLNKIKGIGFKTKSGKKVLTDRREFIEDLDSIPHANYDFFTPEMKEKYFRRSYGMGYFWRIGQIISSRGCPYNCIFCSANSVWHRKVRVHSAQYIIEDIKYLVKNFKINFLGVFDDIFTLDENRMYKVCQYLKTTGLRWSCNARSETVCRPSFKKILKEMKEAGCFIMHFGFESGSDRMIKLMKGPTASLKSHQMALDLVYEAGIKIHGFFMLGTQGETARDIKETKKFVEKNFPKIYSASFFITTPFPGTTLWDICKEKQLVSEKDIEQYSDLGTQYITEKTYCDTVSEKLIHQTKHYLTDKFYQRKSWKDKILWLVMEVINSPLPTLRFVFNFYLRKIQYLTVTK